MSKQLLQSALRVKAKRDLAAFVEYVIHDEEGLSVKAAPHQIAWRDHLNYCWKIGKDAVILSPMTFAKTNWMAVALPLWILGRNPNLRVMLISSAEDVAQVRLETIQRYIDESQQLHEVFPNLKKDYKGKWNDHCGDVIRSGFGGSFVGTVDHSLSAYGYSAKAGNGARADVIIFDDVANDTNSNTEGSRRTLFSAVTTQWITRSGKKPVYDASGKMISSFTIIVMIGTRYHEQDIYAELAMSSPEAYCTLIQGVSDSYDHLDWELHGSVDSPLHPLLKQYGSWEPQ